MLLVATRHVTDHLEEAICINRPENAHPENVVERANNLDI